MKYLILIFCKGLGFHVFSPRCFYISIRCNYALQIVAICIIKQGVNATTSLACDPGANWTRCRGI